MSGWQKKQRSDRAKDQLLQGLEAEDLSSASASAAAQAFSWAEYCLAGDLDDQECPTCLSVIPDTFFMFRPSGLEYWRCLKCLAKTYYAGALMQERAADL